MNWLYPSVAIAGGLIIKRQITRRFQRLSLTRVSIDWREDDVIMTVRDGLGKKWTAYQKGAYWYRGKIHTPENRVDGALNKALTKLKYAYLDEVRSKPKTNG